MVFFLKFLHTIQAYYIMLKNKNSAGPDGIPCQLVRYLKYLDLCSNRLVSL